MANFFNLFGRLWIWCVKVFGGQKHIEDKGNKNEVGSIDMSSSNITGYLQLMEVLDVTSIANDFLNRNVDFYRNMSLRHGNPNYKLNWHFMSGAAAYLPKYEYNILFERFFYSLDAGKGHRQIIDKSFIIYTGWSKDWKTQVSPSSLLHANETAGSMYFDDLEHPPRLMEGPEDPRIIYNESKDEMYLNFNALTPIEDRQMFGLNIKMNLKDENKKFGLKYEKIEPLIQFEHPEGYRAGVEKNWVPILIKGELYYIYSLSPLRIIKCGIEKGSSDGSSDGSKTTSSSKYINKDITKYKKICRVKFNGHAINSGSQTGSLRSGTNWVEYSPGVYFSFARTRILPKKCSYAIYRPNFIVLKFVVDPKTGQYSDPHIISVSDPIIDFDDKLFELYRKKGLSSGKKCDDEAVLTPGSISNWTGMKNDENSDLADVIISINDDMTAMLKIKGFGGIVQKALESAPSTIKKVREISKKGTLVLKAEKKMKKFVEKSFARIAHK